MTQIYLPRQWIALDLILPKIAHGLNGLHTEFFIHCGEVIQRLFHILRTGDDCRDLRLCQHELQRGMCHASFIGDQRCELFDKVTAARQHFR